MANTIAPKNGYKRIRIVNATDKPASITNLSLNYEPLTNLKVLINSQID